MKKEVLLIPLILLLAISLVAIGCPKTTPTTTPPTTTPPTTAPPEIPKEILIGDIASYTGNDAAYGQEVTFGAEAAFEDINKLGGIYVEEYGTKIPVRWITLDCGSDPLKVGPLVEELILNEKVHVLGPHMECPPIHAVEVLMAEKYKIPCYLGLGPYESWLGIREAQEIPWNYTVGSGFHIAMPYPEGDWRYDNPAYSMMSTWFGALGTSSEETNKKVAAFAADDADGRGWYEAFTGAATAQGYECYRYEDQFGIFPLDTTDFTPIIEEWKDAGCEIMWGNCPGPQFGTLWKQCHVLGFHPKAVFGTRAALFYYDISAWGGDLPNGVGMEVFWYPSIKNAVGIGDTTPQSLVERWYDATGKPLNQGIAWDYMGAQIIIDAIERAGTLDADAIAAALPETDMTTIYGHVSFIDRFNGFACQFGQWQKTDNPWVWEAPIVFSFNDNLPATAEFLFPMPYD